MIKVGNYVKVVGSPKGYEEYWDSIGRVIRTDGFFNPSVDVLFQDGNTISFLAKHLEAIPDNIKDDNNTEEESLKELADRIIKENRKRWGWDDD